jgi:glycosyltransferase involved in cell wall biosynthesis
VSSTVTVTMAHWGAQAWIARAVESIRAQTYPDWRLVIVNDADPVPPWPLLGDHLSDPRIVRYDLPENRGRFFIDAVILAATPDPLWALQDPDDFSEPDRFERMVPLAEQVGMAFAPSCWHHRGDDAIARRGQERCPVLGCRTRIDAKRLDDPPDLERLVSHTGYGSGVISTDRIRAVGGFHPDLTVAWDTYLMSACKVVGPWVADVTKPLQHKTRRPGSLGRAPETKVGSPIRNAAWERRDRLYRDLVAAHQAGEDSARPVRDDIDPGLWQEVTWHAQQLRERMA